MDKAPPHHLPPRRLFVGRDQELAALEAALAQHGRTTIGQASLWGLGGVGKTALALEYAHRALDEATYPGGVWWVLAGGRPLDAMLRLAASLRAHAPWLLAGVREDASSGELAEATRRALEAAGKPSLVVLDNADQSGFAELLPGSPVRVLMTTRDRDCALGKTCALGVLSLEDARELAVEVAERAPSGHEEEAALTRVVEQQLGGLAVAVEVAARAVLRWAGGWVTYEKLLAAQLPEALDALKDRSEHYPRGVFAALDMSLERCGEPARRLLEGAALFAPDAVPLEWACVAAEMEQDNIAALRALGELEGLGVAKVDREAGVMSARPLLEHALALAEKTLGPEHPHVATSLSNLALVLHDLGDAAGARPLLERALALDEKTFGPEHPEVATRLSNLAAVLHDLGDAAGARPLLERALAIDEARLGAEHPKTRIIRENLAFVQEALGPAPSSQGGGAS